MLALYRRHLSAKGARFIAGFEGFGQDGHNPYNDPIGACTTGYGHLLHRGNCTVQDVAEWQHMTEHEALVLLQRDAERFARGVVADVHVLRQHRFDAFVSLAYNLGSLPTRIVTLQRAGKYQECADAFLLYVYADGKQLPGLVRRRTAERRLYLTGDYGL